MSASRSIAAAAAVTSLVLTGFYGEAVKGAEGAAGTHGGGGPNGLTPETYHSHRHDLDHWMLGNIDQNTSWIPGVINGGAVQGLRLIHDTVGCALRPGSAWRFDGKTFLGEGLMTPSPGTPAPWEPVTVFWPGDAPTLAEKLARRQDVLTCLVTRLNRFGIPVPIFLSGPRVTPKEYPPSMNDAALYPYAEALWLASRGVDTAVAFEVWPLDLLAHSCALDPTALQNILNLRVCGKIEGGCGLKVHTVAERHAQCTERAEGIWECNSMPVIATRLGKCGWKKVLWEESGLVPQCTPPWGKGPAPDCTNDRDE
jgi:hypothetical protein